MSKRRKRELILSRQRVRLVVLCADGLSERRGFVDTMPGLVPTFEAVIESAHARDVFSRKSKVRLHENMQGMKQSKVVYTLGMCSKALQS